MKIKRTLLTSLLSLLAISLVAIPRAENVDAAISDFFDSTDAAVNYFQDELPKRITSSKPSSKGNCRCHACDQADGQRVVGQPADLGLCSKNAKYRHDGSRYQHDAYGDKSRGVTLKEQTHVAEYVAKECRHLNDMCLCRLQIYHTTARRPLACLI